MGQRSTAPGERPEHVSQMSERLMEPRAPKGEQTPEERAFDQFSEAIGALVAEAAKARRVQELIDAIAWHLSRVADRYGQYAAGYALERFGSYLCLNADRRRAQAEAEEAKSAGRKPS